MRLIESGIFAPATAAAATAALTFPALCPLASGEVVAVWRAGADKDDAGEALWLARSPDGGQSWAPPEQPFPAPPKIDGQQGSLKIGYLTEIAPGRLLAASMWIDRSTHPGAGLFNAQTEGCLPMVIMLAESLDGGRSFSPWRHVPMPAEIGPASLTNPILALPDGTLAMSIETNKTYLDAGPWAQRAVFFRSADGGQSWTGPQTIAEDPSHRIFNWDLRLGLWPDGTLASFAWTYDRQDEAWRQIHRRVSRDGGDSWTEPQPLGFADQAGVPAVLADGRIVLPYVDRFGSASIKARVAAGPDAPFTPESEVVLYDHGAASGPSADTGALLGEMALWSFGLPCAAALPGGEVLALFYAGTAEALSIHWARLSV